jgi:hypothetical protein
MTIRTVNLADFPNVLKSFSEKTLQEQKFAATKGIVDALPEVVKSSPVDTGLYASSWDFTVSEKEVIFGNYAPHAGIIENGARPFVPPIKPLLEWARRVLQSPDYTNDVWRLAKGTQKKIAELGMEPKGIMEKAIPLIIENMRKEIKRL